VKISFNYFKWLIGDRSHIMMLAMMGFVILGGVLYSIHLGEALRFLPDERDYYTLAENLAVKRIYSLDGSQPTAYRPPGYPLFMSIFYALGARIVHLRAINFVLVGFSTFIVYRILMARYSPLAAVAGGVLVLLYPVVFFTAGTLYPQTLATLLFLLACYYLTGDSKRLGNYVLAGLVLGYLLLTVPTFIVTVPIFVVWCWFKRDAIALKSSFLALYLMVAVVGVWTVRNYVVFNGFFIISTNSGENLLLGNSENTTPNAGSRVDISSYASRAAELNEVERDRFYRDRAIEYMLTHKAKTVRLYALKLLNYFNYRNDLVTESESSSIKDVLMLITYYPLLLMSISRLALYKWSKPTSFEALLIILYIASALFGALFFTRIRFRIPYDFLLIMMAAVFVEALFARQGGKIAVKYHKVSREAF
jgi:4-amino-4-deoxy-L-arabinose transferase-like glycosyltransferase